MRRYLLRLGVTGCCFLVGLTFVWTVENISTVKLRRQETARRCKSRDFGVGRRPDDVRLEAEVYTAVLHESFLRQEPGLVVIKRNGSEHARRDSTECLTLGRPPVNARLAYGFESEVDEQTLDDYLDQNGSTEPLTFTDLGTPFVLVSDGDLPRGPGGDFWERFDKSYPHAAGLFTFSRVGFNLARDQAFLYLEYGCGWLCGGGDYIFLNKETGRWQIKHTRNIWVS